MINFQQIKKTKGFVKSLFIFPFQPTQTTQALLQKNISWGLILFVSTILLTSTQIILVEVFSRNEIPESLFLLQRLINYTKTTVLFLLLFLGISIILYGISRIFKAQGTLKQTAAILALIHFSGYLLIYLSGIVIVFILPKETIDWGSLRIIAYPVLLGILIGVPILILKSFWQGMKKLWEISHPKMFIITLMYPVIIAGTVLLVAKYT